VAEVEVGDNRDGAQLRLGSHDRVQQLPCHVAGARKPPDDQRADVARVILDEHDGPAERGRELRAEQERQRGEIGTHQPAVDRGAITRVSSPTRSLGGTTEAGCRGIGQSR
jgi:hypothetical protein